MCVGLTKEMCKAELKDGFEQSMIRVASAVAETMQGWLRVMTKGEKKITMTRA